MIRALLFRIALFALPFIIYEIYLILQRSQENEPVQRRKPWTKLFIAGLTLMVLSFVIEGLITGDSTDGTYVPPHMQDGKVVPGHVDPGTTELGRGN